MGLDMMAFARQNPITTDVDFESEENDLEIFNWRKHPNPHGWMERLYRTKGGTEESFNCVNVQLTLEDLDALEAELGELPITESFFFGQSSPDYVTYDKHFIREARARINDGDAVYYTSWW